MFRRLIVVLGVFAIVLSVGWFAMKRPDISYDGLESVYANGDSRFIDLANGTNIHFQDMGPRDAPAILMVHGLTDSLLTWNNWADRLKTRYRVITIDLPGHGLSRCMPEDRMNVAGFTETIKTVADALEIDSFTLVGHALGGNTAWNFSLEYPERTNGLVLVGATGWPKTDSQQSNDPVAVKLVKYDLVRKLLRDLDQGPVFQSMLRESYLDPTKISEDEIATRATLSRAPCHREAMLDLFSKRGDRRLATDDVLSQITAPTLILQGEADRIVPQQHGEAFAAAITDAELVKLPAGHYAQKEAAEEGFAALDAFLTEMYTDDGALLTSAGVGPAQ